MLLKGIQKKSYQKHKILHEQTQNNYLPVSEWVSECKEKTTGSMDDDHHIHNKYKIISAMLV